MNPAIKATSIILEQSKHLIYQDLCAVVAEMFEQHGTGIDQFVKERISYEDVFDIVETFNPGSTTAKDVTCTDCVKQHKHNGYRMVRAVVTCKSTSLNSDGFAPGFSNCVIPNIVQYISVDDIESGIRNSSVQVSIEQSDFHLIASNLRKHLFVLKDIT